MSDRAIGQVTELAPLPAFTRAAEILDDVLPLLDAPSRIAPSDAAERHVRVETRGVWQGFDREVTPYMVEPLDTSTNRAFKAGAFVGPARSGKTLSLVTMATHPITCDPAPVLILHMDRPARDRWVEADLNPIIHNSPELIERLGRGRDDDVFSRKRFRGMRLSIGFPTPQWLSGAGYRLVLLTDFDHFPPTLGVRKDAPEGSAFDMAMQRTKTYMSRGFVFAESTPAWPVMDPGWSASEAEPHRLPPVEFGIVPLYNRGTRGRWYWECPDCAERFEPRFDRLAFDADKAPIEAGESAEMACPHCGALIGPQHKNEMNRAALARHDGWLHEAETGGGLVALSDRTVRQTEIASWSLDGAAATFANWAELVARYVEATRIRKDRGDDLALTRFFYTDLGKPYARPMEDAEGDLTVRALKEARHDTAKGTAPGWVRFVTVTVDVQKTYFPVQVTGWGADGRRTVIDRFDLITPPADPESGKVPDRTLSPAKYAGDWAVLEDLEDRTWPVLGTDYALRAMALAVDFQGEKGVSDNAEKFWRARRRANAAHRWFLTRGHPGYRLRDRVWHATPDRSNRKGGRARALKLLNVATDKLKDTVTAALERPASEPESFPLPAFLEDHHVAEFCAEERTEKGWVPKRGQTRNESLDLSVQAQALAEHKGLRRVNPEAPPAWARLGEDNPHLVVVTGGTPDDEAPAPKKRKRRIGKMRI